MLNDAGERTKAFSPDTGMTHPQEMQDAEHLLIELKRLLVRHEKALDEEGIRSHVETLERWMESYRRGLAAAHKIADNGMKWLPELRDRLLLAADEIHRLEGEGGNPASKEQMERTEELRRAVKYIDKVIPSFEQLFINHP